MARYAIIDGKSVINVIEYDVAPSNPPPGFEGAIIAVQSDTSSPGWTYSDGTFIGPTPSPAPVIPLSVQAHNELDKSDVTVVRCVSASVTVPSAWQAYRTALRAIANGTDTKSAVLPTRPDYPAGT